MNFKKEKIKNFLRPKFRNRIDCKLSKEAFKIKVVKKEERIINGLSLK